jgi:hypothetical protein
MAKTPLPGNVMTRNRNQDDFIVLVLAASALRTSLLPSPPHPERKKEDAEHEKHI